MQHRVTASRDFALIGAADTVERTGAALGRILRESRLEVWQERDWLQVEELSIVHDVGIAEQVAGTLVFARLVVPPDGTGAYEQVMESFDEVARALRQALGELESLEVAEANADQLPAADPDGPVAPCTLDGLWYRSKAERRIAAALEAANVMFAPNASVRLGVTPDHRETMEPDFLIWQDRKLGVLEVDGPWHRSRAANDHERDRRLKEHGVRVVERYPAERCYELAEDVVADFLRLLQLNG